MHSLQIDLAFIKRWVFHAVRERSFDWVLVIFYCNWWELYTYASRSWEIQCEVFWFLLELERGSRLRSMFITFIDTGMSDILNANSNSYYQYSLGSYVSERWAGYASSVFEQKNDTYCRICWRWFFKLDERKENVSVGWSKLVAFASPYLWRTGIRQGMGRIIHSSPAAAAAAASSSTTAAVRWSTSTWWGWWWWSSFLVIDARMLHVSLTNGPEFVLCHHRLIGFEWHILAATDFHQVFFNQQFGDKITAQTSEQIDIDQTEFILFTHRYVSRRRKRE